MLHYNLCNAWPCTSAYEKVYNVNVWGHGQGLGSVGPSGAHSDTCLCVSGREKAASHGHETFYLEGRVPAISYTSCLWSQPHEVTLNQGMRGGLNSSENSVGEILNILFQWALQWAAPLGFILTQHEKLEDGSSCEEVRVLS